MRRRLPCKEHVSGRDMWSGAGWFVACITLFVMILHLLCDAVTTFGLSTGERQTRLRLLLASERRWGCWVAEVKSQPVAMLTNPVWVDMFWWRFEIVPLPSSPPQILDDSYWEAVRFELTFRNVVCRQIASNAYHGHLVNESGRATIFMRKLELPAFARPWPTLCERIAIARHSRRRVRRHRNSKSPSD